MSESRPLEFKVFRVYDMRRYTGTIDQKFITQYHLQKDIDTHTLCGYKTDVNKTHGRWTYTSENYFTDSPGERDTMCFRCLRVWALKNKLTYPRQWMVDRVEKKEARQVIKRGSVNNE
tara:strand:+ start:62 stop:415 length:354 start_codon:yes stop_codon:yes gene_type:complete